MAYQARPSAVWRMTVTRPQLANYARQVGKGAPLDHDDFGLNQSKIIVNAIDSNNVERDRQLSLRNPRELDRAGKRGAAFLIPL